MNRLLPLALLALTLTACSKDPYDVSDQEVRQALSRQPREVDRSVPLPMRDPTEGAKPERAMRAVPGDVPLTQNF